MLSSVVGSGAVTDEGVFLEYKERFLRQIQQRVDIYTAEVRHLLRATPTDKGLH
jgi:hypothetical protein